MRVRRPQHLGLRGFIIAASLCLGAGCATNIVLGERVVSDGADGGPGGPGGSGNSDGGATRPDAFTGDPCTDYATYLCDLEQSCNLLFFRNLFWGDLATCKERRKLRCAERLAAPGSNETPARIAACTNVLSRFTCSEYGNQDSWPESCGVPPGNRADGAGCALGGQCRGRGCFPADGAACGVCSVLPPLGAACSGVCDDLLQCLNGVCVAYLRQGDSCRYGGPMCGYGLACIGAASGQGKCLQNLGLGATCDPTALECDDAQGLSCDSATKQCRVDPGWPAAGELCLGGQWCRADAWCNIFTYRCEAKRREGEPCGNSTGSTLCLQPATCVGSVCTLPNGNACP